jgi:hypothetical protein
MALVGYLPKYMVTLVWLSKHLHALQSTITRKVLLLHIEKIVAFTFGFPIKTMYVFISHGPIWWPNTYSVMHSRKVSKNISFLNVCYLFTTKLHVIVLYLSLVKQLFVTYDFLFEIRTVCTSFHHHFRWSSCATLVKNIFQNHHFSSSTVNISVVFDLIICMFSIDVLLCVYMYIFVQSGMCIWLMIRSYCGIFVQYKETLSLINCYNSDIL